MKYIIKVAPFGVIELVEYQNYTTIKDCVDGYFELCGSMPPDDLTKGFPYDIYCNESFALSDDYDFNAFASIICHQPIYGNIAILVAGYDFKGEIDSLPMSEEHANTLKDALKRAFNKIVFLSEEGEYGRI